MTFKLLQVVELLRDVPEEGLKAGMQGTIVEVFTQPHEAYEVEFCDSNGCTVAQAAFTPELLRAADQAR